MPRRKPAGYYPDPYEPRRTIHVRIAESVERAINTIRPEGRALGEFIANYALPRFAKFEDQRRLREHRRIAKLTPQPSRQEIVDMYHERALREDRIRDALKVAMRMEKEGALTRDEADRIVRLLDDAASQVDFELNH